MGESLIIIPVLQMGKLKPKEGKTRIQGYTASIVEGDKTGLQNQATSPQYLSLALAKYHLIAVFTWKHTQTEQMDQKQGLNGFLQFI